MQKSDTTVDISDDAGAAPHHMPIYGLDIIRFAAALMVCVFHIGYRPHFDSTSDLFGLFAVHAPNVPLLYLARFGWIGVQVFFVISGFVIAYSSENSTGVKFAINRATRLAPSMWISATICSVILFAFFKKSAHEVTIEYIKSIVFFPFGPWFSGQIWTLDIEIVFYMMIFALVACRKFTLIVPLAYVLTLMSSIFWLLIKTHHLGLYSRPRLTALATLQHGNYFALGIFLWRMTTKRATPALLAMSLICVIAAIPQIAATDLDQVLKQNVSADWISPFAIWLASVLLIFGSAHYSLAIGRFLAGGRNTIRTLGLITYPLYLLHVQIGGASVVFLENAGLNGYASVGLSVAASLVAALIVALWIEPPVKRFLQRALTMMFRSDRPRRGAAAA